MKIAPIPENDWQALNITLEQIAYSMGIQDNQISKAQEEVRNAKTVTISTPAPTTMSTTIPNQTPETPKGVASMAGYSPVIEHGQRRSRVSWATWPGVVNKDILYYVVYASTETTCTISDANIKSRRVVGTETQIILTPGVTYDIRVVPFTAVGAGVPSS